MLFVINRKFSLESNVRVVHELCVEGRLEQISYNQVWLQIFVEKLSFLLENSSHCLQVFLTEFCGDCLELIEESSRVFNVVSKDLDRGMSVILLQLSLETGYLVRLELFVFKL